jgi:hypothetical protein
LEPDQALLETRALQHLIREMTLSNPRQLAMQNQGIEQDQEPSNLESNELFTILWSDYRLASTGRFDPREV